MDGVVREEEEAKGGANFLEGVTEIREELEPELMRLSNEFLEVCMCRVQRLMELFVAIVHGKSLDISMIFIFRSLKAVAAFLHFKTLIIA